MNENVKNSVLNLSNTCIEAVHYIKKICIKKQYKEIKGILDDLSNVILHIKGTLEIQDEKKFFLNSILYCKNILYSIEKIVGQNEKEDLWLRIIDMEILPFVYELEKMLNFNLNILPFQEKWKDYREEREKALRIYINSREEKEEKYQYDVSIIIFAYNKLEYTKKAIESIYQYTNFDKLKVELITVNNGSTDGTEDYFNSLPNTKKINLKYNIIASNAPLHVVEGKYILGFSNDVLATYGWLEKLLECMESDKNIYSAVPTCNIDAISNEQGINVPYKNSLNEIDNIQKFAKLYNCKNKRQWEERSLLMPFICISRADALKIMDGDKLYTQAEFIDDDLSTSLRRAGLKQILVKDTFMHHFGSITLRDAQINNNSLYNMREVYYKKWGVDAWDSKGELEQVEALLQEKLVSKTPIVLCIEPRFGGNSLKIRNYLKTKGINFKLNVGMVLDKRYIEDAKYMFDEVLVDNTIDDLFNKEIRKFNIISFGTFLNNIITKDVIAFLEKLYRLLGDKGQIIFAIKNYHSTKAIIDLLTMDTPGEYAVTEFSGYNPAKLFNEMTNHAFLNQFKMKRIGNYNNYVDGFADISKNLLNCSEQMKAEIRDQLATEYYVVAINKG